VKFVVTIELDVTPGSYDEAQVKADALENLKGNAEQLGFGFGKEPYTVNSVTAKVS
jgi:hypothetical protein